jgi:hypothetical protein
LLTGPALPAPAVPAATRYNIPIGAALDYAPRLWDDRTSLTDTWLVGNAPADAAALAALGSSPYDKFFVRSPHPDPTEAFVVPMIDAILPKDIPAPPPAVAVVPDQDASGDANMGAPPAAAARIVVSTTATEYRERLAQLATLSFNTWRATKPHWDAARCPPLAGNTASCLREAHYSYRSAISDHLPVMMELRYA